MAEGLNRTSRADDVFKLLIVQVSLLLSFLRISGLGPVKGLLGITDLTIIGLTALAVLLWGIGHAFTREEWS